MRTKPIAFIALAGAIGLSVPLLAQSTNPKPSANLFPYDDPMSVVAGEGLYQDYCAACHGASLEGEANWRQPKDSGRMPAPPHDASGHTWHHPDVQLYQIVKYGTAALVGNGYESDMAGYEGILTDEEILQVMAYIKSTWPAEIIQRHDQMNEAVAGQ